VEVEYHVVVTTISNYRSDVILKGDNPKAVVAVATKDLMPGTEYEANVYSRVTGQLVFHASGVK